MVGFHTAANKVEQNEYPLCARVIITIKNPNHNGGPSREEVETLWAMEDRIVAQLEQYSVKCLLLGRLTHAGCRELVFQVSDWKTFRPPVGKWIMQHGHYETDVSEHDGWDFFEESVWPSPKTGS